MPELTRADIGLLTSLLTADVIESGGTEYEIIPTGETARASSLLQKFVQELLQPPEPKMAPSTMADLFERTARNLGQPDLAWMDLPIAAHQLKERELALADLLRAAAVKLGPATHRYGRTPGEPPVTPGTEVLDAIGDLIADCKLLARLAADAPQFDNPLDVMRAKAVRDDWLVGVKK